MLPRRAWSGGGHFQKHLSILSNGMSPWTAVGTRADRDLKYQALKARVSEECELTPRAVVFISRESRASPALQEESLFE